MRMKIGYQPKKIFSQPTLIKKKKGINKEMLRCQFKQGGLVPTNPPLSRKRCINGAIHINVETLEFHYLSSHHCRENVALMGQYEENVRILVLDVV